MEASILDVGSSEEEEVAAPAGPVKRLSDHIEVGQAFRDAYHLKTVISKPKGSCVSVYHCQHSRTREDCAVKIFNAKHMDFDEATIVEEVLRLKAAQMLEMDGIAQFIALFRSDDPDQYELVFSYWDQADPLFDVITHKWMHVAHTYDSRPYEEEDAARIFRGLVITLDKLHSADILHGNLAPDNILVDLNDIDKVYLPDLRWAEKCNDGEKVSKQRGHAGFAAPEQLLESRSATVAFDKSADMWSLGVIMYQILCGYPPFAGDGRDAIKNVQSAKYSFPENEWRFISDGAMDIIKRKLLRKDPAQRCTVADLLKDEWVSGEYFRVMNKNVSEAFQTAATGQLSGTARRLRLHNSKKKFRSGIRAILAENALEALLAGLEKEKVLVSIGQSYNQEKLQTLYDTFQKQAAGEAKRDAKKGLEGISAIKASTKVISKTGFCAVVMKMFPELANNAAAAEDLYNNFKSDEIDQLEGKSFVGMSEKEKKKAKEKRKAERAAHADLIDYREWVVAMSAICMKGSKEKRVSFIFRLFDEDGSGEIDRDEFAELVSGMMLTQSVSDEEMKLALQEEFDAADTDNSGELNEKEFIAAASNSERLSSYFDRLSKISESESDKAEAHKLRREQAEAARVLQARYRGWSTRKKMKDPDWVPPGRKKARAFTKHIVFSHPIFNEVVELSMPISEGREEGLKKLFALADLEHQMKLGPSQFRGLLDMLEMEVQKDDAMRMFRAMDEDGGGFIEFVEFAEAMLEQFSENEIRDASSMEIGNMGTRMWSRGEIGWSINSCLIISATCNIIYGMIYFKFLLVPLFISYFLTFLMAPLMTLFEARPCVIQGQRFCRVSTTKTRIRVHGTAQAELYDLVHSCKFPHGVSVVATLIVCIATLATIGFVAGSEFLDLMGDETFQKGWDDLVLDTREFLNNSGIELEDDDPNEQGYYNADLVNYAMLFQGFVSQCVLVLLLTVYIMSTFSVDKDANKDVGRTASQVNEMIAYYINLKTMLSLLTGVLTAGILLICGVKLAIMFGILAFLLNYIPNFGSLIAMMLPIPIILVDENLNFNTKVIAAVVPALVQGYIGNVLEPAVFGSSLNMTPLSILMALVVWMSLWGVLGAIMAVPLLGMMKILLDATNHPMAKAVLSLIREDPMVDEEAERMAKRLRSMEGESAHAENAQKARHSIIIKHRDNAYDTVDADDENGGTYDERYGNKARQTFDVEET